MKIKLSKIASLLLAAAVFAVPACTDYSADIDSMKKDVKSVQESVSKLETSTSELKTSVTNLQNTVNSQSEAIKKLQEDVKALEAASGDVEKIRKALDDLSERVKTLESASESYKSQIASLTSQLDLKADKTAVEEALASAKAYTDAEIQKLNAYVTANTEAIEAANVKISNIETEIVAIKEALAKGGDLGELVNRVKALEEEIAAVKNSIIAINASIEDIWNRIQSVTFVPQYTDGGATFAYVINDGKVIAGNTTLTYDVRPADKADSVAAAFLADPTAFAMKVVALKTRAAEEEALVLSIKSVTAANGQIFVTVTPSGIDPKKYLVNAQPTFVQIPEKPFEPVYSTSLQLNVNRDVRSTEYVSLFPDVLAVTLEKFANVDKDGNVTPISLDNIVKFPYTNTDEHQIYEGVEAIFGDGQKIYSQKQLLDRFGLPVDSLAIKYTLTKTYVTDTLNKSVIPAPEAKANLFIFKNEDTLAWNALPKVTVQLDPAKNHVERSVTVGCTAHAAFKAQSGTVQISGPKVNGIGMAHVTKAQFGVKMYVDDVKWSLNAPNNGDYYVDNHRLDGSTEKYIDHPTTAVPDSTDLVDLKNFGITLKDFSHKTPKTCVIKDGETVTGAEIHNVALTKTGISFDFTKFDFAKKYDVTALYELPLAEVTVTGSINTIDRQRDTIVVVYPDTTFALKKDAKLECYETMIAPVWKVAKNYSYITEKFGKDSVAFMKFFCDGIKQPEHAAKQTGKYWATAFPYDFISFVYGDNKLGSIDAYTLLTSHYGQVIRFEKKLSVDASAFKLVHNEFLVAPDDTNTYYSQVKPKFTPADAKNISAFDVYNVDLRQAFNLKVGDEVISDTTQYKDKYGVTVLWSWKKRPVDNQNIKMFGHSQIYYGGHDMFVTVLPSFKLKLDYGNYFYLPTGFEKGGVYNNYYVKKYNPIKSFTAVSANVEKQVQYDSKYSVNVVSNLSMLDQRGAELLDRTTCNWVKGTGANGFANNVYACDVYGLGPLKVTYTGIPEAIQSQFTYDKEKAEITYHYNAEIGLVQDIVVTATVSTVNRWSDKEDSEICSFTITFKKPVL